MISFEYNKNRIILLQIAYILMVVTFGYLYLNAESLVRKNPNESLLQYRLIANLLHNNAPLLKFFSLTCILLFSFTCINLIKFYIKGKTTFRAQDGVLHQDNKSIVKIKNIKSMKLVRINKNDLIYIYSIDKNDFINSEKNIFRKIKYKLVGFTESTPLILNISNIKTKPKNILEKLNRLTID